MRQPCDESAFNTWQDRATLASKLRGSLYSACCRRCCTKARLRPHRGKRTAHQTPRNGVNPPLWPVDEDDEDDDEDEDEDDDGDDDDDEEDDDDRSQ